MGKQKSIHVLPSMIKYPDSKVRGLAQVPDCEKEEYVGQLVQTVERQLNYYLLRHPKEADDIF